MTRLRSRSKLARPYICCLSILFTCPSTAPELCGSVSPAVTASRARTRPAADDRSAGGPSRRARPIQTFRSWPRRSTMISAKSRMSRPVVASAGLRTRSASRPARSSSESVRSSGQPPDDPLGAAGLEGGAVWAARSDCRNRRTGFGAVGVAKFGDPAREDCRVDTSAGDAFTQVGCVLVVPTAAGPRRWQQLSDIGGAGEAADRLTVEWQCPGDIRDRSSLRQQLVDGGVAFPGSGGQATVCQVTFGRVGSR
ncbi:hypothetical protein M2275_008237 [Rhodococcus opacus]|nr:hypothetical protein [Rhodococcus opacus]